MAGKKSLKAEIKPHIERFLAKLTQSASKDIKRLADEIAADFALFTAKRYALGDSEAEKDLRHLEAQVKLLGAKYARKISKETVQLLAVLIKTVGQIVIAALRRA